MDTRLLHQFTFNRDNKWDIQLQQGQIAERDLADLLCQKIELKSESYLWRRTGNICIEFSQNCRPRHRGH